MYVHMNKKKINQKEKRKGSSLIAHPIHHPSIIIVHHNQKEKSNPPPLNPIQNPLPNTPQLLHLPPTPPTQLHKLLLLLSPQIRIPPLPPPQPILLNNRRPDNTPMPPPVHLRRHSRVDAPARARRAPFRVRAAVRAVGRLAVVEDGLGGQGEENGRAGAHVGGFVVPGGAEHAG